MRRTAGRRKGSGKRKENDALALEKVVAGHGLPIKGVLVRRFNAGARQEFDIGDLVAFFLGSCPSSGEFVRVGHGG